MPNPQELAITLPLGVVERLLAMAMWACNAPDSFSVHQSMYTKKFPMPGDREAIKLVDREVEEVKKAAGRGATPERCCTFTPG